MAEWKKIVVSGSDISQLNNDSGYLVAGGTIDSASVADRATLLSPDATASFADSASFARMALEGSGSFSGSFEGDGSGLTGLATNLTVDGDTGTQDVDLITDDLQILGTTNEIETAVTKVGNDVKVTLGLPDNITVTASFADLAGTVHDGNITTAKLADGAVTTAKITDANITTAKIADANVTDAKLASDSVTTVKIVDANVTAAKLATDSVETAKIVDANVTTAKLADDAVTTVKITDANVTAAKLATNSVETAKIVDGNVTTAKIADANVTDAKLASNSVTTDKIVDANVTTGKLADSAVTTAKINDGAVTNDKITDGTIANVKLVNDSVTLGSTEIDLGQTVTEISGLTSISATTGSFVLQVFESSSTIITSGSNIFGDKQDDIQQITGSLKQSGSFTLSGSLLQSNGVISGSFQGDGSGLTGVTVDTLNNALTDGNGITDFTFDGSATATVAVEADGATLTVGANGVKVSDSGIDTTQLADDAVTTVKITDANVTTAKIADSNVTTAKIADSNVTTAKIADLNVTTEKLAANAVTTAKITDANVTAAKLATNSVETAKIVDANVTTAKIADANVTTGKLADNAVTTAKITDANVTAAKLASNSVETAKIVDANVTAAKLATDSVETAKIVDGNVTTAKLADDAVTTIKITDANVTAAKLATDSVETAKIVDANVTTAKIADSAVTTAKIADGDVTNAKLANDSVILGTTEIDLGQTVTEISGLTSISAVTGSFVLQVYESSSTIITSGSNIFGNDQNDIQQVTGSLKQSGSYTLSGSLLQSNGVISGSFIGDGSGLTGVAVDQLNNSLTDGNGIADFTFDGSGAATVAVEADGSTLTVGASGVKVSDAGIDTTQLADNAVTTAKITDLNVTTGKLADGAVTTAKITDANVTTAKIADANVTTAKIADANVTVDKLATDSVTTAKIVDANVTTAKIADANVTTGKLADDAVTTVKITDANVTAAKLATDSVETAKIVDANVTTAKLADNAVTTVKITDANVTTAKIADSNVTTAKIADSAVTNDKITDGTIANAKLVNDSLTFGVTEQALGSTITEIKGLTLISADTGTFVHQIFESSSTIITSGSNVFGNDAGDIQQITGSLKQSGSITLSGSLLQSHGVISGSFIGDGSGLTGLATILTIDGDSGGTSTVDLQTQNLDIAGTANEIETSVSGQTITIGLPTNITVTASYADTASIARTADSASNSTNAISASATVAGQLFPTTEGLNGQALVTDGAGQLIYADAFGTGSTKKLNQTVAAETWSFVHNLDEEYPIVQIWDTTGDMILPDRIVTINANTVEIIFPVPVAGIAAAMVGGMGISASEAIHASTASVADRATELSVDATASFADVAGTVHAGNITTTELADNAVTNAKITDGTIANVKLVNDSVILGTTEVDLGATSTTLVGLTNVESTMFSGSFKGDGSLLTGLVTELDIAGDTGTDALDLKVDTLNVVGTTGEIETAVTNNQIQIGLPSNVTVGNDLTVTGDATIAGDLVVGGAIVSASSLEVADQFIILASGSNGAIDGGIIINQVDDDPDGRGKAFAYDSSANRWALQSELVDSATTITPDAYMGVIQESAGAPSSDPTYGGTNGKGTIFVDTSNNEAYIYI